MQTIDPMMQNHTFRRGTLSRFATESILCLVSAWRDAAAAGVRFGFAEAFDERVHRLIGIAGESLRLGFEFDAHLFRDLLEPAIIPFELHLDHAIFEHEAFD